jgi:hypothetical protein
MRGFVKRGIYIYPSAMFTLSDLGIHGRYALLPDPRGADYPAVFSGNAILATTTISSRNGSAARPQVITVGDVPAVGWPAPVSAGSVALLKYAASGSAGIVLVLRQGRSDPELIFGFPWLASGDRGMPRLESDHAPGMIGGSVPSVYSAFQVTLRDQDGSGCGLCTPKIAAAGRLPFDLRNVRITLNIPEPIPAEDLTPIAQPAGFWRTAFRPRSRPAATTFIVTAPLPRRRRSIKSTPRPAPAISAPAPFTPPVGAQERPASPPEITRPPSHPVASQPVASQPGTGQPGTGQAGVGQVAELPRPTAGPAGDKAAGPPVRPKDVVRLYCWIGGSRVPAHPAMATP